MFDEDNIRQEVDKLSEFISSFTGKYNTNIKDRVYLGYSNGANMVLALTFLYPSLVDTAVLLHPMLPLKPPHLQLDEKTFIVTYGKNDQMIPAEDSVEVIEILGKAGAKVLDFSHNDGHGINKEELEFVASNLSK